jgi:hypothetical protein
MTIEKQIDELNKEQFMFTVFNNVLVFESYFLLSRENTRKRNWNILKRYERLSSRYTTIALEQVPLTEEIKNEVLQEYIKTLKVMTWAEYKK